MNRLVLLPLPWHVQKAVETLEGYGVHSKKLFALVCKRNRGRPRKAKRTGTRTAKRGTPSSLPFTMQQFSDFVDACKDAGIAETDVKAIRTLIELEAKKQGCTTRRLAESFPHRGAHKMTVDKLVRSFQQRLSRHRKRQKLLLHNSQ